MLDAVTRYDIDGLHFDDYFYPTNSRTSTTAPPSPSTAAASPTWPPGAGTTWT